MALDQPGVGVSSAHDKSIACVTRVRGLRLLSASRCGARPWRWFAVMIATDTDVAL